MHIHSTEISKTINVRRNFPRGEFWLLLLRMLKTQLINLGVKGLAPTKKFLKITLKNENFLFSSRRFSQRVMSRFNIII